MKNSIARLYKGLLFSLSLFFLHDPICSQSIPINNSVNETARLMQLNGSFDSLVSFTIRPLITSSRTLVTRVNNYLDSSYKPTVAASFNKGRGYIGLMNLNIIQQFNTHHPYGYNDGPMIAAKGYQSYVSAGVYARYGPLEIQLEPEYVFASNGAYETTATYGDPSPKSFSKLYPGQSTIKLKVGHVSAGVSTANLWWGPGTRSSLLMSNNAPGFLHGFISSAEPIKTGIGSFEWQLIGAKLTSDNSVVYENTNLRYATLPIRSRYLSAYVITYQPRWAPGLFLGMSRALQRYKSDIYLTRSFFDRYIPVVVKPFQKENAQGDDTLGTDQLASFFMRWVFPKANAEVYWEYGFNDYNQNVRDYLMSPFHSAAHIVGFRKIVPLRRNAMLELNLEITQMTQTPDHLVREAGDWYVHWQVLQGYTQQNQIIGSGAGFAANVQSLSVKWIRGWSQWGFLFERMEHDPIFHTAKWNDVSLGIMPQASVNNFIFSGVFQFMKSDNYGWQQDMNRFNFHSKLAVRYLF